MHSIPVGSVLLLILVDLVIAVLLSVFIGVLVARAGGRPIWIGIVLGALVPVAGPLIWLTVVVARDTSLARASRNEDRGTALYAACGLLGVSAVLLLVAIPIPWGSMDGSVKGYSLFAESSAADTGVGLFAIVGSVVVLVGGIAAVLLWTCRTRVAVLVAVVGAAWLIVTVDGLITFSALTDLSRTVDGLSKGQAVAEASPGWGLYLSLAAAILAVAGAVVLAMARGQESDTVPARWTSPSPTPTSSPAPPGASAFPSPYPSPYPPPPPAAGAPPARDEF